MNRQVLAIGDIGSQLVSKFNSNFQKSHIGGNWFNVEDYGAVHDNSTDDTVAIQTAINACAAAGGGTVFFPNGIYIIAGGLQNGIPCSIANPIGIDYNSQLYIPAYDGVSSYGQIVIKLLGETPVKYYWKAFDPSLNTGVVLRSTITGSGIWPSVICGSGPAGYYFNYNKIVFENILVLVLPVKSGNGPDMCGINMLWADHFEGNNIACSIDTYDYTNIVQPTSHVFGLATGLVNSDFPIIRNYAGLGFYYGLIAGEGVHAYDVNCFFNKIGIMALGTNWGPKIDYAILHWNQYCIADQQETIYGIAPAQSTGIKIDYMGSEAGHSGSPAWTNRVDVILDNDNYLVGQMDYNLQYGGNIAKLHGGYNLMVRNLATNSAIHWATASRPTAPNKGCVGYNTTTDKMECWDGSQWNNLW